MDALDRVLDAGRDLLTRVDAALVRGGAPPDHGIWPLARRVGALPGDAVESLAALRPDALLSCAAHLRTRVDGYAHQHAVLANLAGSSAWEGATAEAFAGQVRAFADHLGGHPDDSLAGRLTATVSYVEDVAGWITVARRALAGTLAAVLVSAEAVALHTGTGETLAAAAIGARVLETVAALHRDGSAVHERWVSRLGEVVYRPPTGAPAASDGSVTRVAL
jgi:hypothetical protein